MRHGFRLLEGGKNEGHMPSYGPSAIPSKYQLALERFRKRDHISVERLNAFLEILSEEKSQTISIAAEKRFFQLAEEKIDQAYSCLEKIQSVIFHARISLARDYHLDEEKELAFKKIELALMLGAYKAIDEYKEEIQSNLEKLSLFQGKGLPGEAREIDLPLYSGKTKVFICIVNHRIPRMVRRLVDSGFWTERVPNERHQYKLIAFSG